MDVQNLVAIDTHVHAEVSCCQPPDLLGKEFDGAADKYFGTVLKLGRRPAIPETIEHYRERKIGFVMFTVDCEANLGRRRISNEEIAEFVQENDDIMIAFASIDPHKRRMASGRRVDWSRISAYAASSSIRPCRDFYQRPAGLPAL